MRYDPQCIWPAWTSRRRSMWQDRSSGQKHMDDHNVQGWMFAALLCEMAGFGRTGDCRAYFFFCEMHPPRKRRSPPALADNGHADLGKFERIQHKMSVFMDKGGGQAHPICSFVWAENLDHVCLQDASGTDDGGFDGGSGEMGFVGHN